MRDYPIKILFKLKQMLEVVTKLTLFKIKRNDWLVHPIDSGDIMDWMTKVLCTVHLS